MAGETCVFLNAFDTESKERQDLAEPTCFGLPIVMFTYGKQIFDVVTKREGMIKKRLMNDILTALKLCRRFEIHFVGSFGVTKIQQIG